MAAEVKKEIQLEIAHILFIDIVGYSKLSINEQHAAVEELARSFAPRSNCNAPKPITRITWQSTATKKFQARPARLLRT
jgi:hypothetical protein